MLLRAGCDMDTLAAADAANTNVILAALYRAASGGSSQPENLACVHAAARLWGRVLSLAVVEPQDAATAAVDPAFLYSVGERLAIDGRAIALLSVAGDGLRSTYRLANIRHPSGRNASENTPSAATMTLPSVHLLPLPVAIPRRRSSPFRSSINRCASLYDGGAHNLFDRLLSIFRLLILTRPLL